MTQELPTPLYPERQIIFGNGLRAQLLHSKPGGKDEHDNDLMIFWFRPLEYLKWEYKLEDKDYTSPTYGWIKRSYPREKCYLINESPLTTIWLITQTFDGQQGINFDKINNDIQIQLKQALLENKQWKRYTARLNYQIANMVDMPDAYRTKVLSELRTMMDTVMTKEENKPNEEGMMVDE